MELHLLAAHLEVDIPTTGMRLRVMWFIFYNRAAAFGYGQSFSAEHVNNWGKTTAKDIILGTKKFRKSHPYIDTTAIGCIGASYGGFMTMYLATQTDIFSAAVSHAGISALSSYWGEGFWGYAYSAVAIPRRLSPGTEKTFTSIQSPLFQADKVNTPILLNPRNL